MKWIFQVSSWQKLLLNKSCALFIVGFSASGFAMTGAEICIDSLLPQVSGSAAKGRHLIYPEQRQALRLNTQLKDAQVGWSAPFPMTPENQRVSFYVQQKEGSLLVDGRIVGTTIPVKTGLVTLVIRTLDGREIEIATNSIQAGSMKVLPVLTEKQKQETASRIREAYENGEWITFDLVHRLEGDPTCKYPGLVEKIVLDEQGHLKSFNMGTYEGLHMGFIPANVYPGSIRPYDPPARPLSGQDQKTLELLRDAQASQTPVHLQMKKEFVVDWGSSRRAEEGVGFVRSIRLYGDGEWIIVLETPRNTLNFRLEELDTSRVNLVGRARLSGTQATPQPSTLQLREK